MAKKASLKTKPNLKPKRPPAVKRQSAVPAKPAKSAKPNKARPVVRATAIAIVKPRRKNTVGTKPKSITKTAPLRQTSRGRKTPQIDTDIRMSGYVNPMFDPPIEVFDTVPSFPTDFEELHTPKSPLAKEIAAKAPSPEEYVRTMMAQTQKRSNHGQTLRINPYSLDIVPDFNVHNFDDPATASYLWGLSESIERQGVIRALMVHWTGGKIVVDAGEHRLRATFIAIELRNAHIEGVPITFSPRGQSDLDRLYQQRMDNTVRRLTILEEGILVKRIIAMSGQNEDVTIREIARNYGTSVAIVQSYLETAALPAEVQHLIRQNRIGATFARQIYHDTGNDSERTLAIINEAKAEDGKIMPKHIPAEQLAKARAESGTTKRTRRSSKPAQGASASPRTAPNQTPASIAAGQNATDERDEDQSDQSDYKTHASLVLSLLEEAEPGIMENGLGGLGFANQEHYQQLCDLLGKLSVQPLHSVAVSDEEMNLDDDDDPEQTEDSEDNEEATA